MNDYSELVKALRGLDMSDPCPCDDSKLCKTADCIVLQAANAIEELQAEVERLKQSNEELREKQTFIDHYGDKWMTSAKDVPTAAYEHGYMDGRNEAAERKHGEWIPMTVSSGMDSWKCSVCGRRARGKLENLPYCHCGAKMGVQE